MPFVQFIIAPSQLLHITTTQNSPIFAFHRLIGHIAQFAPPTNHLFHALVSSLRKQGLVELWAKVQPLQEIYIFMIGILIINDYF
jgi:hypothetical protein